MVRDPDTGVINAGIYRHEVKGPDRVGCMFNPAHHAGYIYRRCKELGKRMEAGLFIGHHPAAILGTLVHGAMDVDELELMGGLMDEPLEVVPAETVDLPVPAFAEIAKKLMRGAPRALEAWAEAGPHVILTGHLHRWLVEPFVSRKNRSATLQVHCGTGLSTRLRGEPNEFALIEIHDHAVEIRRMVAEGAETGFDAAGRWCFVIEAGDWALSED